MNECALITPDMLDTVRPEWRWSEHGVEFDSISRELGLAALAGKEFREDYKTLWNLAALIKDNRVVWAHQLAQANDQYGYRTGSPIAVEAMRLFSSDAEMTQTLTFTPKFAGGLPLPQITARGSTPFETSGLDQWKIRKMGKSKVDMNLGDVFKEWQILPRSAVVKRSMTFVPVARKDNDQSPPLYESNFCPGYRVHMGKPFQFRTITGDSISPITWVASPDTPIMGEKDPATGTHTYFRATPRTIGGSSDGLQLPQEGSFVVVAEPIMPLRKEEDFVESGHSWSRGAYKMGDDGMRGALLHDVRIDRGAASRVTSRGVQTVRDGTRFVIVHLIKVVGVERTDPQLTPLSVVNFLTQNS